MGSTSLDYGKNLQDSILLRNSQLATGKKTKHISNIFETALQSNAVVHVQKFRAPSLLWIVITLGSRRK